MDRDDLLNAYVRGYRDAVKVLTIELDHDWAEIIPAVRKLESFARFGFFQELSVASVLAHRTTAPEKEEEWLDWESYREERLKDPEFREAYEMEMALMRKGENEK